MNLVTRCFGLLGLLAALAVPAQDAPPAPAAPRPFTIPTPTTFTLTNGVKATFIDFGVVPKVTIAMTVRVGALNDGERTWLSDLTAELMKEGTASSATASAPYSESTSSDNVVWSAPTPIPT